MSYILIRTWTRISPVPGGHGEFILLINIELHFFPMYTTLYVFAIAIFLWFQDLPGPAEWMRFQSTPSGKGRASELKSEKLLLSDTPLGRPVKKKKNRGWIKNIMYNPEHPCSWHWDKNNVFSIRGLSRSFLWHTTIRNPFCQKPSSSSMKHRSY